MKDKITIGTRGSQLALWQASFIKSEIEQRFNRIDVDLRVIKTTGDRILDRPLAQVGGKGLFVKEIEAALMAHDIDLAVHSMKDMPGELPEDLTIGAVPPRENPFDVLISNDNLKLSDYRIGAIIGTSSLRRASQIKHVRPDLTIKSIRGNLDTRLRKLKSGEYDAIVLAAAGLIRLEQEREITEYLDETTMIPAVGQGALCIEIRKNDPDIAAVMERLDHAPTKFCVMGERAFLKQVEGSCHIPVACYGRITDQDVLLTAVVASEDGRDIIREQVVSPVGEVEKYGRQLANGILKKGGRKILEQLNSNDG